MVKLTPKLIAHELPDEKCQSLQKLALPGRSIEKIVRLSACSQLIRLDLSSNSLTSLEGVSQNTTLKWLAAPGNKISTLQGLGALDQLQVLNLGHNSLEGLLRITGMVSLRALMLNDNQLTGVAGLGALPELNTLILKQNKITDLSTSLHGCTALAKLQLGHNRLSQLGSALSEASSLAELRVSHNQLTELPEELSRNRRLKIVEVGGNPITKFKHIQVLTQLPSLHQLNLRGCPVASQAAYPSSVLQHLPVLDVLDSRKLAKSGLRGQPNVAATTVAAPAAIAGVTATGPAPAAVGPQAELQASKRAKVKKAADHASGSNKQDDIGKADSRKAKGHEEPAQQAADEAADEAADAVAATPSNKKRKVSAVAVGDESGSADVLPGPPGVGDRQDTHKGAGEHAKKKEKSKKLHEGQRRQAQPPPGRSFLADLLDPIKDHPVEQRQLTKAAKLGDAAAALSKDSGASGLIKVIETLPAKDAKAKKSKASKGAIHSGAAAANMLLQGGKGLETLQYGIGSASSWN